MAQQRETDTSEWGIKRPKLSKSYDSMKVQEYKVVLYVADVGQGTAIVIEVQETSVDQVQNEYFLYDGGNADRRCYNLFQTVGKVCSKIHEGKCEGKYELNGIVVSHPDLDHLGGVVRLLENKPPFEPPVDPPVKVTPCPTLLTTAFLKLPKETSKKTQNYVKSLLDYLHTNSIKPAVIYNNPANKGVLHQSFHCIFPHKEAPGLLYSHTGKLNINKQEPLSSRCILNESSVLLQVNRKEKTIDVSLHGDAHGYQIEPYVRDKKVQAFLVPHHGSKKNSILCEKDPERLLAKCVPPLAIHTILSGESLAMIFRGHQTKDWVVFTKWQSHVSLHESVDLLIRLLRIQTKIKSVIGPEGCDSVQEWGKKLLADMSTDSSPETYSAETFGTKVSEAIRKYEEVKNQPDFEEFKDTIRLIQSGCRKHLRSWCYEVAVQKFYACFEAETYIITSGWGPYYHPDMEVLNGIARAAIKRRQCQIVLTNSAGLEPWKFSDVFFDHKYKDKVSVWYLDDKERVFDHPPCVTIDPLQKLYIHQDQNEVKSRGMKQLEFAERPLDWTNLKFLYSHTLLQILEAANPETQNLESIDPYLSDYLKNIGHQGDITLSALLEYILGFKVADQILTHPLLKFLDWCTCKVKEESSFVLSATGLAVQSCEIHLHVPNITVNGKRIKTTILHINNIRTKDLQLKAEVGFESDMLLQLSDHLDYHGTCGHSPADYLAAIGMNIKRCVSIASDLSVGELLALLLSSTKAIVLVHSLPGYIATNLINYRIDPLQTIIDFQQSEGNTNVREAHIVLKIPKGETSHMTLADGIHLQVCKAIFQVFPSYNEIEQLVEVSGEFTINDKYRMRMKAIPNFYATPEMEFTLADSLSVSEVLELFGIKRKVSSAKFQIPFTATNLLFEDKISAGFTVQQPLLLVPRVSSVFIDIEWFTTLPPFWPECMKVIKEASLRLSLVFPLESEIAVGIKARFTCELNLSTRTISLDCSLAAIPNTSQANQYSCFFSLRPFQRLHKGLEAVQGASILDMITALNETMGEKLRTVFFDTWPELTNAIELRELSLQLLSSGSVEGFKLDVGIRNELELITEKLALSNARLLLDYSPGYVQLECEGYLTFFKQYETFVSFLLPTPDSPGELRFENESTELTLERFASEMFELGDSISTVPVLSDLLSVSINSIHVIFERQGQSTVITHAKVVLTKEELSLGLIKISNIEITVTIDRIESKYTFDFSLSGFIGDKLYARLSYSDSETTPMLKGDVILASFQEIDVTSALKEFTGQGVDLPPSSALLGDSPGSNTIAQLAVTIRIYKEPVSFELACMVLNLEDVIQFKNFAINQLWFKYESNTNSSNSISFFGSLCKLDTQESAALEFTWDQTAITAKVVSGHIAESSGGLLKLSSLLELVGCEKPDIPELDKSAPFFDLELKSGSVSFKTNPIELSAFEVSVVSHGELCLINDPQIILSDVTLCANWEKNAQVYGIVSAIFHFSTTCFKVICRNDANNVLLTAQIEPNREMEIGTEVQHIGQNEEFSSLVPPEVSQSPATPRGVAINVTRKQFLFLTKITQLGTGAFFASKSGLALSISLQEGFKFKDLWKQLSFVDDLITVKTANLAVSSLHNINVSEFHESISILTEELEYEDMPFSNLPVSPSSPDLNQWRGVSIFAAMDINRAKDSALKNVIQIQDNPTSLSDVQIRASIVKSSCGFDISIQAQIQELTLLGKLNFKNIQFLYHMSEQEHKLQLSGTLHLDFVPCDFDGSLTVTKSDARFEVKKAASESSFARPLGMDITLTGLAIKAHFDLENRCAPLIELEGSINIGHLVDLTAMIILRGFCPKVFVVDITTELSVASLFSSLIPGGSKPPSLMDFKILKGHFHYATEGTCVEQWMVPRKIHIYHPHVTREADHSVVYSEGIHVKCDVKILFMTFDVRLDISKDYSSIEISGRTLNKIDWIPWVKLTDRHFKEGPEISYRWSKSEPSSKLEISVGLEILDKPWFIGTLSYEPGRPYLTGSVEYEGTFLWMENPRIELKLMPVFPFVMISDFSFGKSDKSGSIFNLAENLKKFCSWLFDLVKKVISQDFDLHLQTDDKNPDPNKFSVVFTISGTYKVKFFNSDRATVSLDLPKLPVKVPKGFSLGNLPKLIVETLMNAGKKIVTRIVDYIKSRGLMGALKDLAHAAVAAVKKVVTLVSEGVKTVFSAVASGVKTVCKTISGWFRSFFGSFYICTVTGEQTWERIAEIIGGRGGKPLHNEQGVGHLFAPLIGIHAIHQHGKQVHEIGMSTVNLPSNWKEAEGTEETEETEEIRKDRKLALESLRSHFDELGPQLEQLAFIMLEIQDIELQYQPTNRLISVKWTMDSSIMEIDQGDFDYHIKVLALTPEGCGTIFDGKANCNVPITFEQEVPLNAYQVTVSIKASITMNVRTSSITDDVTVEGKWKHAHCHLKPPTLQAPQSIGMHYDHSLQKISGSLATVADAQAYIVRLVDVLNPSTFVEKVITPQAEYPSRLEYTFPLTELPKSALGQYTIQAQSVGSNNFFSEFSICNTSYSRQVSPTNVRLLLPDTNSDRVEVRWDTRPTLRSFSLHLYAEPPESEQQEIIGLSQTTDDSNTTQSCSFRMSEIAEALDSKNISHKTRLVLQCHVIADGNENILPSNPACSNECHLLPPPASVECNYSHRKKSLHVLWEYVPHALSYRIQLVNIDTGQVALECIHTNSWKDLDLKCIFTDDDLKSVTVQDNVIYKVQVFTLGHGEQYLGSLESCASTTFSFHKDTCQQKGTPLQLVQSLKMSYTPSRMDESICLSWEPPQFGADSYTVSVNDSVKVTNLTKTKVYLSPIALDVRAVGEYSVSVVGDDDPFSNCTFKFTTSELFTDFSVTAHTATSLSVQYGIIPNAPINVNCYLIVENASNKHVSRSILLQESNSKVIILHHLLPETTYILYAVAFTEDCSRWAVPRKIEAATLLGHKEMCHLGKNLLDDASGADMTMGSFTYKQTIADSSPVEGSWAIEPWTLESKCNPPPMGLPTMYCTTKDASVMRNQVIDLSQHGFSPAFLHEHKPDIRIQSWVCAPDISNSETYYKMVIKLLSEDHVELDKVQKGPLRLQPNGEWRAVELLVSNYGPHLRYIEFTDSGSSENDNITRVAGTTVRLGYSPASCVEVYSLPHCDSLTSGKRTCLVQLSSASVHTLFQSWKIEYYEADPESGTALSISPRYFYAPIGTQKVHYISLSVPIKAVCIKILAVGEGDTEWKFGDAFIPPMDNWHVFQRNLLAADMLEPQMPLHRVAPDTRAWADLSQEVENPWSPEHWTEEKSLGFDPPPYHSNFVLMKCSNDDVQRVAKIDLWALGFSPTYLAQQHPEFLVEIHYAVEKNKEEYKQELQLASACRHGTEPIIASATVSESDNSPSGTWHKLTLHATPQPKSLERYLVIYDKGYGCVTGFTKVKPLVNTPLIYVANLQCRTVKLQFVDTESIKDTIKQSSPNLLVEYRILQDVDDHGEWYKHYFGSSSELSSGIPVSNLSPSTIYEFQVTLTDSQKQDKYFSATTSGCTLPAMGNMSGEEHCLESTKYALILLNRGDLPAASTILANVKEGAEQLQRNVEEHYKHLKDLEPWVQRCREEDQQEKEQVERHQQSLDEQEQDLWMEICHIRANISHYEELICETKQEIGRMKGTTVDSTTAVGVQVAVLLAAAVLTASTLATVSELLDESDDQEKSSLQSKISDLESKADSIKHKKAECQNRMRMLEAQQRNVYEQLQTASAILSDSVHFWQELVAATEHFDGSGHHLKRLVDRAVQTYDLSLVQQQPGSQTKVQRFIDVCAEVNDKLNRGTIISYNFQCSRCHHDKIGLPWAADASTIICDDCHH